MAPLVWVELTAQIGDFFYLSVVWVIGTIANSYIEQCETISVLRFRRLRVAVYPEAHWPRATEA